MQLNEFWHQNYYDLDNKLVEVERALPKYQGGDGHSTVRGYQSYGLSGGDNGDRGLAGEAYGNTRDSKIGYLNAPPGEWT